MRILIVKLSSLGDLFHALPAVACIKKAWNPQIDWVASNAYADLVRRFAPVDRVISFPRKNFLSGASSFLRELRADKYDFIFDMQGLLKSALVACAARGAKRIGPSFHREGSRFFYDAVSGPRNKQRHAIEENYDLVRYLGIPSGPPAFPVRWDLPSGLPTGQPRIGLIVQSRWETKNWPAEHFSAVASMLGPSNHLFLFGAPEDRQACQSISEKSGVAINNLCGRTSLTELGGWLASMDLVITVDSGPMHLAAAAGTPVLAIFGATEAARTGPYGAQHRIIARQDLACRPCLSRTCQLPEQDRRCLTGISPQTVVDAAFDMLKRKPAL